MSRNLLPSARLAGRLALGLLAASAAGSIAGCIAPDTDPAGDFQKASDLVAARSAWTPSWNAPWADDTTSWDGRSPLTATQAVTVALQNNRELRVDLEGIAGAKADLAQSGLLPNPVLSASLGTTVDGNLAAVSLMQELTQIWLLPAHEDAAASALRAQVQSASDHALRLVADVRSAHARVVYGQRGVKLTDSQIELVQRSIAVAQSRLDAGDGTQLDVNRLREELLSVQADHDTQQLSLSTARRELLALLGMAAADADWQAADDGQPPDARLDALTESEAVTRACDLRLDVQAARSIVEEKRHDLRAASLNRIPDVSLGGDMGHDQDNLHSRDVNLDVELPIFDTKQVGVAKAVSDLRAAQAAADQVSQAAILQTRTTYLALQTNLHLAGFFREQVLALAQANLDVAQRSYDAGEEDLTVVLDTQKEFIESQSKLNDLQLDVATSAAELEYVVGGQL